MIDTTHSAFKWTIWGLLGAGMIFAGLKVTGIVAASWWYVSGPIYGAVVIFLGLCLYDAMMDRILGSFDDRAMQWRDETQKEQDDE